MVMTMFLEESVSVTFIRYIYICPEELPTLCLTFLNIQFLPFSMKYLIIR